MKKTLFIIFASCGLVIPSLQAADYSQSFSGNVRVESTSVDTDVPNGNVETLSTAFGGEDEESSTGGDTHLQWDHQFASDDGNTQGTGFLRFKGDGNVRYNIEGTSELGDYQAGLKAEWETDDGFSGPTIGRDQFAVLTHIPSGVFYKIGREEWLNNEKGYTTDFLSATTSYANQAKNNRFSMHQLGWNSGVGFGVSLLIQRDVASPGQASGSLFGDSRLSNSHAVEPTDTEGFGIRLAYAEGSVDAELTFVTGNQDTNVLRATRDGLASSVADIKGTADVTQLYLAFPIQDGRYKPFLNYGTQSSEITQGQEAARTYDRDGYNLGVSLGFGASDLVLAYGSLSQEGARDLDGGANADLVVAADKVTTDSNGFDVMWITNQDPLTVALSYTTQSVEIDSGSSTDETKYGVRLEYGF